jgi:hypothetical protein
MAHYYPKIANAFYRDPVTGKVDRTKKSDPLYDTIENCKWIFTEKVDGTSIAVYWNGDKFEFFGHTTRSQIPPQVMSMLTETFGYEKETLFEQVFGDKPAMVYGEAYGPSIGPGKMYCDTVNFIVFDITVGTELNENRSEGILNRGSWLEWDNVIDICKKVGLNHVPEIKPLECFSLSESVHAVEGAGLYSYVGGNHGKTCVAEGVVARPRNNIYDRYGNVIRVKIKTKDFPLH